MEQKSAVILKSNPHGLIVQLDAALPFEELLAAVGEKYQASAGFFRNARLALTFRGRSLAKEEEYALVDAIVQNSTIEVLCLVDELKESAEYYRKAVLSAVSQRRREDATLYYGCLGAKETLESEKNVVILGDVNPGATVISAGSIVVLGCCMGNLHAGATGDSGCFAAALTMKPASVRIAKLGARSAIVKKRDTGEYPLDPRLVYIKEERLQIKALSSEALREFVQLAVTNQTEDNEGRKEGKDQNE